MSIKTLEMATNTTPLTLEWPDKDTVQIQNKNGGNFSALKLVSNANSSLLTLKKKDQTADNITLGYTTDSGKGNVQFTLKNNGQTGLYYKSIYSSTASQCSSQFYINDSSRTKRILDVLSNSSGETLTFKSRYDANIINAFSGANASTNTVKLCDTNTDGNKGLFEVSSSTSGGSLKMYMPTTAEVTDPCMFSIESTYGDIQQGSDIPIETQMRLYCVARDSSDGALHEFFFTRAYNEGLEFHFKQPYINEEGNYRSLYAFSFSSASNDITDFYISSSTQSSIFGVASDYGVVEVYSNSITSGDYNFYFAARNSDPGDSEAQYEIEFYLSTQMDNLFGYYNKRVEYDPNTTTTFNVSDAPDSYKEDILFVSQIKDSHMNSHNASFYLSCYNDYEGDWDGYLAATVNDTCTEFGITSCNHTEGFPNIFHVDEFNNPDNDRFYLKFGQRVVDTDIGYFDVHVDTGREIVTMYLGTCESGLDEFASSVCLQMENKLVEAGDTSSYRSEFKLNNMIIDSQEIDADPILCNFLQAASYYDADDDTFVSEFHLRGVQYSDLADKYCEYDALNLIVSADDINGTTMEICAAVDDAIDGRISCPRIDTYAANNISKFSIRNRNSNSNSADAVVFKSMYGSTYDDKYNTIKLAHINVNSQGADADAALMISTKLNSSNYNVFDMKVYDSGNREALKFTSQNLSSSTYQSEITFSSKLGGATGSLMASGHKGLQLPYTLKTTTEYIPSDTTSAALSSTLLPRFQGTTGMYISAFDYQSLSQPFTGSQTAQQKERRDSVLQATVPSTYAVNQALSSLQIAPFVFQVVKDASNNYCLKITLPANAGSSATAISAVLNFKDTVNGTGKSLSWE